MTERHFRVVQLDGKKVEFGGVSITSKASPGSAARKLLTSIAHEKGLKKNKKASMPKVKFCIQEYTQGSSKKVYGPYVGHFHKYTAAELKKAKTAGGKIKFTMKPVVKLAKKNMKGGESENKDLELFIDRFLISTLHQIFKNNMISRDTQNLQGKFTSMLNLLTNGITVNRLTTEMSSMTNNLLYESKNFNNKMVSYFKNPNNNKIFIKPGDKIIISQKIKEKLDTMNIISENTYKYLVKSFNDWVSNSKLNNNYKINIQK